MGGQEPIGGRIPSKKEIGVNNVQRKKPRKQGRQRRKGETFVKMVIQKRNSNQSTIKSPKANATSEVDTDYSDCPSLSSSPSSNSSSSSLLSSPMSCFDLETPRSEVVVARPRVSCGGLATTCGAGKSQKGTPHRRAFWARSAVSRSLPGSSGAFLEASSRVQALRGKKWGSRQDSRL